MPASCAAASRAERIFAGLTRRRWPPPTNGWASTKPSGPTASTPLRKHSSTRKRENSTMNDFGTLLGTRTIKFERLLPGPIEIVWAFLTESDKRGQWLATGPMDLRPGGAVHLKWKHADLSPHKRETPERFKKHDGGHE